MEKLILMLSSASFLMLTRGIYFLRRNNRVHDFLINLVDIVYDYDIKCINAGKDDTLVLSRIESEILPNYFKMVFSFKRLSYKNYLTGEEMDKLGLNK